MAPFHCATPGHWRCAADAATLAAVADTRVFLADLAVALLEAAAAAPTRNFDALRHGDQGPAWRLRAREAVADARRAACRALGLTPTGGEHRTSKRIARLADILEDQDQWQAVYAALDDARSRELFISLLAYRVLGRRHVKLPTNTAEYWRSEARALGPLRTRRRVRRINALDGWLDEFDLAPIGAPMRLTAHAMNILQVFLLEQYRWRGERHAIAPCEGDVVIDAGACWGDTALWFANRVGSRGRVVSLEFMPDNLAIFRENLGHNPDVAGRISIVEHALWGESGATVSTTGAGPGGRLDSSIATDASMPAPRDRATATTITLDDLVERERLDRVDFIKMDIEGAELASLRAGERTLRRFRPRLAICIYHSLADMREIPLFVQSLNLEYEIHIGHASIHEEETVMFAQPRGAAGQNTPS